MFHKCLTLCPHNVTSSVYSPQLRVTPLMLVHCPGSHPELGEREREREREREGERPRELEESRISIWGREHGQDTVQNIIQYGGGRYVSVDIQAFSKQINFFSLH